ncbi:MAG: ribonuclease HI [Spirochaetales bacterium]|nr:ribonuclease HI [Spirochaetales bacterium]
MIRIYTDGGCSGNPGPGGWAYVILADGKEIRRSGGDKNTTNNRMELTAVIMALADIKTTASIEVFTDSQYVQKGISEWIKSWKKNGWKTAARKPVKNQDLWQKLDELSSSLSIHWHWVEGHAGNAWNEICDSMVRKEMGI